MLKIGLNNQITLISTEYTEDEYGNQEPTETSTIVYCGAFSIQSQEYYNANQIGLKPTIGVYVNTAEYGGQTQATYNSAKYNIYRVYDRQDGYTELYMTPKEGKS